MTIEKGHAWGEPATLPGDALLVHTDREISRALDDARRRSAEFPTFGVLGGDLCRTVGGTGQLKTAFPVDVGEVLIDGRHHYFVAHVVARRNGWRDFVVAMNAQWVGEWNFGPKAHPNDGIVDAYEAHLQRFDWRKVKARLPSGTHVPHPRIEPTRGKAVTFGLGRDYDVFIDGEAVERAQHLAVRVLPDAIRVIA